MLNVDIKEGVKDEDRKAFEELCEKASAKGLRGRKFRNYVTNKMKKRMKRRK